MINEFTSRLHSGQQESRKFRSRPTCPAGQVICTSETRSSEAALEIGIQSLARLLPSPRNAAVGGDSLLFGWGVCALRVVWCVFVLNYGHAV